MKQLKLKLLFAAISVLVTVSLITGATLAWLTLSTNPEVQGLSISLATFESLVLSTSENGEYTQYIDISSAFADCVPLKPVSTADGVNWFIATYNETDGSLNSVSDFILDNTYAHANIKSVDSDGNPLVGNDLLEAKNQGYYVYTDIWMKNEEDDAKAIHLSFPHTAEGNVIGIDSTETQTGAYGTYALPKPYLSGSSYADGGFNSVNALRVGFMIFNDPSNPNLATNFIVYEPNATSRSRDDSVSTKPAEANGYVVGYDHDSAAYSENTYIKTYPIGLVGGSAACVDIASANLITQRACGWDQSKVVATLSGGGEVNSNDISYFGKFMNTAELYGALGSSGSTSTTMLINDSNLSSNTLVTLQKDTPVRIRIFVWIEGQDVDCWNDIASGSFYLNLEFVGE